MTTDTAQTDIIIDNLMIHIPFDGWTDTALKAACADAGCDTDYWRSVFPDGISDAISAYGMLADTRMEQAFLAWCSEQGDTHIPTHKKIRQLILLRLEQARPHKEVVRKTLAVLARPQMAPLATRLLYQTIDTMWRAAGDRSTDYNFYTKRATLSAVYSATLLAFLSDDSPDNCKTEAFLDRRLKDVAAVPNMTRPVRAAAEAAGGFARALARSMMDRNAR